MATLADMGVPGGGNGIFMPKLKYRYRVTFQGLGSLLPNDSKNLTFQAITCGLPEIEFEETALHRYNSTDYVAGKHSFTPISIVVEDDITGLASESIKAQLETQERVVGVNLDGRWLNSAATGTDYKFATIIEQLDGNEGVVSAWLLESCWFKQVQFGDMDWSSSEAVKITISLRYGHARNVTSGEGYGTAQGGYIAP